MGLCRYTGGWGTVVDCAICGEGCTVIEHPVEKHEEQLSRMRLDVDDLLVRMSAIEKVSAAREEQVRGLFQSVGRIEVICDGIRTQVAQMIERTETELMEAIEKLSDRVAALERTDSDKWKQAVGYVLAAAVAGIVGYLFR